MGTICGWEMPAALCFPPSTQMLLFGVCSSPKYYSSHPYAGRRNPNYLRRLFSLDGPSIKKQQQLIKPI